MFYQASLGGGPTWWMNGDNVHANTGELLCGRPDTGREVQGPGPFHYHTSWGQP